MLLTWKEAMSNFLTLLILIYNSRNLMSQNIDTYDFPGKDDNVLEMTRHPGKTNLKEISVCLRFINY